MAGSISKKICYVGNFDILSVGEPEIAKSLEELGYEVVRVQERTSIEELKIKLTDCDLLLFAKFRVGTVADRERLISDLKIPKVCWVFDLYWGMAHDEGIS